MNLYHKMNLYYRKRKDRTPVTILIIPDNNTKPIHYSITRKAINKAIATVIVVGLGFMLLSYSYLSGLNDIRNLQKIKKESQAKAAEITEMNQQMEAIKKQQEDIDLKQQEILKLMGVQADTTSQVNPSRGALERNEQIAENANIESLALAQDIRNNVLRDEKEVEDMLANVRNDQAYFRAIPNQWPVRGEITSEYGVRRSPWTRREVFHEGIDIKSQVGTDIVAAADGEVVYADWMLVYGKTVVINHGNGLESKYGHTSVILVKKGDKVSKGQVIARVGTTGMSTGPHLHFTVTKNGQLQDPMIYLSKTV